MTLFKKSQNSAPRSARRPGSPTLRVAAENDISIVGPGMKILGELVTEGTVRIEGAVEGTIQAGKSVVVGRGGEVLGDIFTQDAVIGGRVNGTVTAEHRLELQSTCSIEGDIRAPAEHLKLDEGARFSGRIHMAEAEMEPLRALPAGEQQAKSA